MTVQDKTLCLVDGSGYIFRAFYALPPMNRADGTPTNAVYGFTNMMLNLIHENCCSHLLVVLDAKRQNFRNEIYPEYKANRRQIPEDLVPQFPLIRAACDALNVPWLEMEGYEADDLIATYAYLATTQGWHTTIISADKDLMQLMSPSVSLYDPMKKKMLDIPDVQAKFGVSPDKVVDVQSLMGDTTDNIPGATGIGPKTAAELIRQFGSLHNLLGHLDEVPQQKRREGLIQEKERILLSEKLVTLDKHAPVQEDFTAYQIQPYSFEKLSQFLLQNGFQSLVKRIQNYSLKTSASSGPLTTETQAPPSFVQASTFDKPPLAPQEKTFTPQSSYTCIQNSKDLNKWLKNVKDTLVLYPVSQNSSLHTPLLGLALATTQGQACYIPLAHQGNAQTPAADLFAADNRPVQATKAEVFHLLSPIFNNPKITKVGHDIKQIWHHLSATFDFSIELHLIADTQLMSYELDGMKHAHSLQDLAHYFLHYELPSIESITGNKTLDAFDCIDLQKATQYASLMVDLTAHLYELLLNRLKQDKAWEIYQDIDAPLLPILYHMEHTGVLVDVKQLILLEKQFSERLTDLTRKIHQIAGEEFNINSPVQLGTILYEKRGLTGGKRGANGHWTTDVKALETLAENGDELAVEVLKYRSASKLKSTYIDALLERAKIDPRIHTTFSLTSANTGRLASSDPNLQNIPVRTQDGKEIRQVFVAKPGYKILSADYSQIELRLMAQVADVAKLKASFLEGEDIHARTASQILNIPLDQITADQRRRAKAINFGIIYGISPFGLAANLAISRGEAKAYIDTYFTQYPEIKSYMTRTEQAAEADGYVTTPLGRKVYLPGLLNRATKSFALRAAINAPIQGGAADLIKMAMIRVDKALKAASVDATLLLQVHDELVFEVAETDIDATTKLVKQAMEQVVGLSLPLVAEVGVGDNWKSAH